MTDQRNQENTVYVGNLDERVDDTLLWELLIQAGPVVDLHLPKDRVTQQHQSFAFCEYASEPDADYAIRILNLVKLFGKPIRVNKVNSDKKDNDVGATLFIGNLDFEVDEKLLFDTFSPFGVIIQTPKISRDAEQGTNKGFGFVSYETFESADAAIEAMDGQYLMNKPINVSYSFKKDGKGERHGSEAERLLASQSKKNIQTQKAAPFSNPLVMETSQTRKPQQNEHLHMPQMLTPMSRSELAQYGMGSSAAAQFQGGYGGGFVNGSARPPMQQQSKPPGT